MGGFVAVVSGPALEAAVTDLTGEQLLRIGFVLDDLSRMDEIVAVLREDQLDGMLEAAVEPQLWAELDGVLTGLTGPQAVRIAGRYRAAPAADRGPTSTRRPCRPRHTPRCSRHDRARAGGAQRVRRIGAPGQPRAALTGRRRR